MKTDLKIIDNESKKVIPEEYFDLKTKIHDRLLDLMDLSLLDELDHDIIRSEIRQADIGT